MRHPDHWIIALLGISTSLSEEAAALRALPWDLHGPSESDRVGLCTICGQVAVTWAPRKRGKRLGEPLCAGFCQSGDRHQQP